MNSLEKNLRLKRQNTVLIIQPMFPNYLEINLSIYISIYIYTTSLLEPHPQPQDHTGQQPHVVRRKVKLSSLKGRTLQPVPLAPFLLALVAAVPDHAALRTRAKDGVSVRRSGDEYMKEEVMERERKGEGFFYAMLGLMEISYLKVHLFWSR